MWLGQARSSKGKFHSKISWCKLMNDDKKVGMRKEWVIRCQEISQIGTLIPQKCGKLSKNLTSRFNYKLFNWMKSERSNSWAIFFHSIHRISKLGQGADQSIPHLEVLTAHWVVLSLAGVLTVASWTASSLLSVASTEKASYVIAPCFACK